MMQNQDSLISCSHCLCDACYSTQVTDEITNQMCYGCGYMTNSAMKKGNQFYDQQIEILPELYKEISWENPKTNEVWFPSTINMPDKGMVFVNGKTKENWKWAVVKAIDIPEEERFKYPNPTKKGEFYSKRMDMKTLKEFKQGEFIEALEELGVFEDK